MAGVPNITSNDFEIIKIAEFGEVEQYRTYPRKTVILKNNSGYDFVIGGISACENFSFYDNRFINGATIPNDQIFHIELDFNPQDIGDLLGHICFTSWTVPGYGYSSTTPITIDNCASGIGIEIPTADYYVATTGNDATGDGSIGNPYATIKKAFGLCSSGELIYLRQGDYDEQISQYYGGATAHADHADADNWTWAITIASYPGETATIKCISETSDGIGKIAFFFGYPEEKYFIFEDMVFDGIGSTAAASASHYLGSCSWHSSFIKFWNCEFKNRHDWGYPTYDGTYRSFNSMIGISTTGIELWYCKIHGCDEHGIYLSSSSGGETPGTPWYGERAATDCKLMYNDIYDTGMNATGETFFYQGYGIHCNNNNTVGTQGSWYRPHLRRNLFEGNYVHSCNGGGILLGGNFSSTAQNNIVKNCIQGLSDYYSGCSGNYYINNTVIDCESGIRIRESSTSVSVYNNIFYGSDPFDLEFPWVFNGTVIIENNIMDNLLYLLDSSYTNNLYNANPLILDLDYNVFSLSSGSQAVSAGSTIINTEYDFYGNKREEGIADLGAITFRLYEEPVIAPIIAPIIPRNTINELHSGGGKIVYPNDPMLGKDRWVGNIDELEGLVSKTLIRDKNVKQFDKDIKEWLQVYVSDQRVKPWTSTFSLLNLAKLSKITARSGNPEFLNRGLKTYLSDLTMGVFSRNFKLSDKGSPVEQIKQQFELGKDTIKKKPE